MTQPDLVSKLRELQDKTPIPIPDLPEKALARFWSNVNKDGPIPAIRPDLGPCWIWLGTLNGDGYGTFCHKNTTYRSHRISLKLAGVALPLDRNIQADHLCEVRNCIRPDHLQVVTGKVNSLRTSSPPAINARKTHCIRGHALSGPESNVRISTDGGRKCRTCENFRQPEIREQRLNRRRRMK